MTKQPYTPKYEEPLMFLCFLHCCTVFYMLCMFCNGPAPTPSTHSDQCSDPRRRRKMGRGKPWRMKTRTGENEKSLGTDPRLAGSCGWA